MPRTERPKKERPAANRAPRRPRRLRVWQRLFLVVGVLTLLCLLGTAFFDFNSARTAAQAAPESSGWTGGLSGFVVADEGEVSVQLYTEGLAELAPCGRGTELELESWEPFVAEDGTEYYHVFYNGQYAYILCEHLSSEASRVLRENQVYVRTTVNLLTGKDSTSLGVLAEKGTSLSVLDYDYLRADGSVHMYQVKLGDEIGWINAAYVSLSFVDAMKTWSSDSGSYALHSSRTDSYGGGSAADLDYWPHEKGDFADAGNAMPESCYSIHIPLFSDCIRNIDQYLALVEGTEVNTFVFTIQDGSKLAYPSEMLEGLNILRNYDVKSTLADYAEAVRKVQEAGYYTVARMTVFDDSVLAREFPSLAVAGPDGKSLLFADSYWPSIFSREAWKVKLDFALEAVALFDFDEIQFDYLQFPYGLSDEEQSGADLRNEYHESRAQALQRFLLYASDLLHSKETYLSAVVYGEAAEPYVNYYGQYWPAVSTVVDVICCTPYPESYANYWTSSGYYRSYQHPYSILNAWSTKVTWRQSECSSPAAVRTWIQIWDNNYYTYDAPAIQREILGLFDNDLTGGYMAWSYYGDLDDYGKMGDIFHTDYYRLWQEAEAQDVKLSTYMNVDTSDAQE